MKVDSILRAKGNSVVTAKPDSPVSVVTGMMANAKIGAVVISVDKKHVNGILSERDIVAAIASKGKDILAMPAANLMTKDVVTCSPTDIAADLMAVMTAQRIRHLPVLADGELAGIISIGDVVKCRVQEIEAEAEALREYVTQS
jgi:CBS domain-containing protein